MPWVAPRTWVAGDVLTAAQLNTDVRDNILMLPRGQLGYAEITANQAGITTEVDVTGLSVTTPVLAAGRRVRLTVAGHAATAVVGDEMAWRFREGAALLRESFQLNSKTTGAFWFTMSHVLTPTAAAHTYKVTMQRIAGTGTVTVYGSATFPTFLLVEDLGGT